MTASLPMRHVPRYKAEIDWMYAQFDASMEHMHPRFKRPLGAMLTGSAALEGVEADDVDLVIHCNMEQWQNVFTNTSFPGWVIGGSMQQGDTWVSLKRQHPTTGRMCNLLICNDAAQCANWQRATDVVQLLHRSGVPVEKPMRVAIHRVICGEQLPYDVRSAANV